MAKASTGVSMSPTPSLATDPDGGGAVTCLHDRLSPAAVVFGPHRAQGLSIGMLIVLLAADDLKERAQGPFDIAVQIADNRR